MRLIITAQASAATSNSFRVDRNEIVSVVSKGLAGAETATIQISNGDSTFSDIAETRAIMTATLPHTTICAVGDYRVVKSATVGLASVAVGE